ncbi:MAG TPA: DUF1906 domain-containing protein [Puia sp.]|nr:DUF1906 domain-containing protein [Puia sp.]
MKKGFDASRDLTPFAAGLKAAGYDFAGRYYNVNNHSKNLTLAEAQALTAAGLRIIVVWENGYPTATGYFNYQKGVFDGTAAYHYALDQISQPAGSPIYFAVDYDASGPDVNGPIMQYFQGIHDAFNTIGTNNAIYPIGVYGSGLTCSALLDGGKVTYTWLAQSMGWGGSRAFTAYNIKQDMQKTECPAIKGGVAGDPDTSPNDLEGSFTITPTA